MFNASAEKSFREKYVGIEAVSTASISRNPLRHRTWSRIGKIRRVGVIYAEPETAGLDELHVQPADPVFVRPITNRMALPEKWRQKVKPQLPLRISLIRASCRPTLNG